MEHTNTEVANLEKAVAEATEHQLRELNELQLTLVGGGFGDTIL